MKNVTLAVFAVLSLNACSLFGGNEKPWCDPLSPLHPGLTPEQLAECEAMADGETGGNEPTNDLACYNGEAAPWCAILDTTSQDFSNTTTYTITDIAYCAEYAQTTVSHVGSWSEPVTASARQNAWCMTPQDPWYPGSGNATGTPWRLCTNTGHAANEPAYYPAHEYAGTSINWPNLADCSDPQDTPAGACQKGLVAIGDSSDRNLAGDWLPNASPTDNPALPAEWTCACEDDSDCQEGAVCEAGLTIVGGLPRATLCTWDDGFGTANGAAPDGPVVYGLSAWSDGIKIVRDNVTITGAMFVQLWSGTLNDDQQFDAFGTLTHCGPRALCHQLALSVGDTVLADEQDVDDLMAGQSVTIPVLQATGNTRLLTVTIDFDGVL